MKRLSESFNFFLFERETLEEYLQKKAQEGWMIIEISESMMKTLTFVACPPKKCYFYTDFISNYKSIEEAQKYRAFVEEYGYTYVLSQGPLQVFVSDEAIDMPLREQSKETKKELFKISIKQSAYWIIFGCLMIFTLLFDIFNGKCNTVDFWNNHYDFFSMLQRSLNGLLYLSFLFPIIIWRIHEKKRYSLKRIKIRTFIQTISMPIIIWFLFGGEIPISGFLLLEYITIAIIIVVYIFRYLDKKNKNKWMKWGITILLSYILIVGGNGMFHRLKATVLGEKYYQVMETGEGLIPDEYLGFKETLTYEITKNESMFMKDNQYIARNGEEVVSEYEIVNVKNTIMKDFILNNLTTNDLLEKEYIGRYIVYIQKNKVIISDTTRYLSFSKNTYKGLTQKQLDVIFDYVEDFV